MLNALMYNYYTYISSQKEIVCTNGKFKYLENVVQNRGKYQLLEKIMNTDKEVGGGLMKVNFVSHNGGPCTWPICGYVFDEQVRIANTLCKKLNDGESVDI